MSLVPSAGQDAFAGVSSRLTSLATTLADPKAAKLVAPSAVAVELNEIADLTFDGLEELEFSPSPRAANLAPAVSDAIDGMEQLASQIQKTPDVMTAAATVEAISGWAELTSGATIALHRL